MRPKGYKHSEETKRRMSLSRKMRLKEYKHTEKTKRRMSIKRIGRKPFLGQHHSEDTKIKMSLSHKGKKLSEETKTKIRDTKLNDLNPNWKGDNVLLIALHDWVRRRKIKLDLCECCKVNKPYDLANISGLYKRDVNDFEWLCRSCHMKKDGRAYHNLKRRDEC